MNAQPQQQQQQQGTQDQAPLTNANASYEEDKRNEIGQLTTAQPGTLAEYGTIPKDEGIGNEQDKYVKRRSMTSLTREMPMR